MQRELESDYPALDFQIVGINEIGHAVSNSAITEGRDLPWLQDEDANNNSVSDVWYDSWDVTYRDVVVLDEDNALVGAYNLTLNNLANPENYNTLRNLFLATATSDGDVDHDGNLTAADIDLFFDALATGSYTDEYDLNGDSLVDEADVDELVVTRMGTSFGDVQLDGVVDIRDFNRLAVNYDPLGVNVDNGWAKGNFDGDSDVDIYDFNELALNFNPLGPST